MYTSNCDYTILCHLLCLCHCHCHLSLPYTELERQKEKLEAALERQQDCEEGEERGGGRTHLLCSVVCCILELHFVSYASHDTFICAHARAHTYTHAHTRMHAHKHMNTQ